MPLDPSTAGALKEALATVVVIPVTPMRPDGSPEWGTYANLIRRVVDAGISVVTPNGNTGEFYALTPAEARQATETAVRPPGTRSRSAAGPRSWSGWGTTRPARPRRPGTPGKPAPR